MSEIVRFEKKGAVGIITLNRPDSMNAFDTELRAGVVAAFERAASDDGVRAVIFTGEGRCFSAGADLKAGIDRDVEEILQVEYRPVQAEAAAILGDLQAELGNHEEAARALLGKYADKDWSLCNAMSFTVIDSRGVGAALLQLG